MEENLDKLFDYRPLIPGSGRFASIVGIGGGAGRVVDQMRKCCLPDVQLYAFGMNRKEMDELSLCGKYLIGQEGLGSGKDCFLAEYECSKSFPAIETVLRGRLVAVLWYALVEEQERGISGLSCRRPERWETRQSFWWQRFPIRRRERKSGRML